MRNAHFSLSLFFIVEFLISEYRNMLPFFIINIIAQTDNDTSLWSQFL